MVINPVKEDKHYVQNEVCSKIKFWATVVQLIVKLGLKHVTIVTFFYKSITMTNSDAKYVSIVQRFDTFFPSFYSEWLFLVGRVEGSGITDR